MTKLSDFEKEIRRTFHLPKFTPKDVEGIKEGIFINKLPKEAENEPFIFTNKPWSYALIVILILVGLFIAIGPTNVLAQIERILRNKTEVSDIDPDLTSYQLDNSVSDTKDGVTLTIEAAFLSTDQTIITFSLSDLPAKFRPIKHSDPVCNSPAYLLLPDGSEIQSSDFSAGLQKNGTYKHLLIFNNPGNEEIEQATLVFPCLEGAALGKGPMDWQFILDFTPITDFK